MLKDIKKFIVEQGPALIPIAVIVTFCVYKVLVTVAETNAL
jgi:hypothetical protein